MYEGRFKEGNSYPKDTQATYPDKGTGIQPKRGVSPVCRGWSTGTDEADQEGSGMKEKVIELLQNLAAAASIFIFLFALYILLAALE